MFLEAKTTKLIDSLEIATVKFLNSVVERRQDADVAMSRRRAARSPGARRRLIGSRIARTSEGSIMAQSKVARRVTRNHARYRGRHEINVVPMIDMMIILVFFLIFTAVFTKTNILELNLPGADCGRA